MLQLQSKGFLTFRFTPVREPSLPSDYAASSTVDARSFSFDSHKLMALCVIIGVTPANFKFPSQAYLWDFIKIGSIILADMNRNTTHHAVVWLNCSQCSISNLGLTTTDQETPLNFCSTSGCNPEVQSVCPGTGFQSLIGNSSIEESFRRTDLCEQ